MKITIVTDNDTVVETLEITNYLEDLGTSGKEGTPEGDRLRADTLAELMLADMAQALWRGKKMEDKGE